MRRPPANFGRQVGVVVEADAAGAAIALCTVAGVRVEPHAVLPDSRLQANRIGGESYWRWRLSHSYYADQPPARAAVQVCAGWLAPPPPLARRRPLTVCANGRLALLQVGGAAGLAGGLRGCAADAVVSAAARIAKLSIYM